jgi:hypothetical protein
MFSRLPFSVSVPRPRLQGALALSLLFSFLLNLLACFSPVQVASAQPYTYGSNAPSTYGSGYSSGYGSAYGTPNSTLPTLKPLQGSSSGNAAPNSTYGYGNNAYGGSSVYGSSNTNSSNPYMAPNSGYNAPMLQGRVSTAPAGSVMTVSLNNSISSQFARVGDRVSATLNTPLLAGGQVVLPAGSTLEGQVASAGSSGRIGRPGELDLRFSQATTPNGTRVPLSARIQTKDGTGVLKAQAVAGRIGKGAMSTAIGAGLGAALGTAMVPLSGGSVGKGAIYGTALGATMGAANALWQKGDDIEVAAGNALTVVLDTPVTVSGNDTNYDNGNNYGSGTSSAPAYQPSPSNFYAPSSSAGSGFYKP